MRDLLLNKWSDFSGEPCHNLATIADQENLTTSLSNTLWRMSL